MELQEIRFEKVALLFILLWALRYFLLPLTKFTCGDLFSFCKIRGAKNQELKFCKSRARYWKWKLRFFTPSGSHADILLTMVELGHKNYQQFNAVTAAQITCKRCKDQKVGMTELDRATRAFKSAENIRKQCSFYLSFGGSI
ncbi:MAG TPA: hypothetical protein VJ579_03025 [Candidatus Paceibacterota bacterium]|nr:hypothetical protein [Candidatus Paceibacterota bacterium]